MIENGIKEIIKQQLQSTIDELDMMSTDPVAVPSQAATEEKEETLLCERCGSPMLYHKGKPGQTDFYGCSAYPNCRHTIKIKSQGE